MDSLCEILRIEFGPGRLQHENEFLLPIAKADLLKAAALLSSQSGRLVLLAAEDLRARTGDFRLNYIFAMPQNLFVHLQVPVSPAEPSFPSLTPTLPAANWYEREVKDMFGLIPLGHPDPRRLVLHSHWPKGVYPLRKDCDPAASLPVAEAGLNLPQVEGEGVFEVPVGPIHAGIIEPGHFRFSTIGEKILNLEARLFYTHKGTEKLCEGKSLNQVLPVAERLCGVCSASHSTAFCLAAEKLCGIDIPPRAVYVRTLVLELERLYNHVGDVGNICAGTGFAFGTAQGGRLKEKLLALNESVFGSRYLRGINCLGGVRRDVSDTMLTQIAETLRQVEKEFMEVSEILLNNDSLIDRLATTGRLAEETADDLSVVGPAARASGLDVDTRRDHPYLAYSDLKFDVILGENGDVLDRVKVRIGEAEQSFRLVEQILGKLAPGELVSGSISGLSAGSALGYVESPRGQSIHYLAVNEQGRIDRYMVRSASYANWPAVPLAVQGNIVPDFPLINKSFELCYACLDR